MQYAAIDIGTNSCRLLVAQYIDGKLETVYRQTTSNRLGEGLCLTGKINQGAMQRTVDCLEEYKTIIANKGVDVFYAIATSAVREADNQEEFMQFIKAKCSITPEVISGQREAELSYSGVKKGWQENNNPLVIDLGGGSTEIIWQDENIFSISLPVGAVRVTEALMSVDDIAEIISVLGGHREQLAKYPLVMVGGTVASLVAVKLSLEIYDSAKVHGQMLSRFEIADIYNLLATVPLRLRQRLPGLQPERADIIVKGTMIVLMIMDILGKDEIIVSENDILAGIIEELHNQA